MHEENQQCENVQVRRKYKTDSPKKSKENQRIRSGDTGSR